MSLLTELKRRNVFKIGAAYLVVGWVVVEVASVALPAFEAPDWVLRVFILLVMLGLPLALVLAWIFDLTPDGLQVTPGKSGNGVFYTLTAVLAAGGVAWFLTGSPTEAPETEAPPVVAAGTPERSIAVLPFVSLSSDEDDRFFGQGLAEELLNALAQFPELEVAARTSAFSFDGQDVDLREVGDTLNVAHVLEGSVRRSGERLRVTAQLIRVADGYHLWSETYERTSADVFDIQDDIVRELSRNLQLRLGVGAGAGRAEGRAVDPRAYETYLRGLYLFGKRESDNDSRREAYAAFRMATAMAPDFADGWAALAMASVLSGSGLLELDREDYHATLIEAMDRALALDPDNARAHAVKAVWHGRMDLDIEQAEYHRLRALELAPNSVEPHYASALVKVAQGDAAGSMQAFDRAVAIDPLNRTLQRVRANALAQFGQYSRARAYYLDCGDECGPQRFVTLNMWLLDSLCSGDPDEVSRRREAALAERTAGARTFADGPIALSSLLHGGDTVAGLDTSMFDVPDWGLLGALWYARRGDLDRALDRLQTSYERGNLFQTTAAAGPLSCAPMAYPENLLSDPRYHAFWEQPGLAELAAVRRANGQTQGLPQ